MIPKFRAWKHKESPEMINDIDFIDWKNGIVGFPYQLSRDTFREDEENINNMILMQSTGLKDKNGVEIFEGDIVEYAGRANNHGVPWGWEFTTFGKGVVKYNLVGYSVFDLHTDNLIKEDLNELLIRYEEIDIEVIGNVYENSELLKEQNK